MNSLQSSFLAVAPVVKPAGSAGAGAGVRLAPSLRGRISACLAVPPTSAATSAPRELSAASRAVIEDEARYLVGTYNRSRVVIVSGCGCKLYDADGREYLDLAAGIAVSALGHADPDLVAVIADQAGTLVHISNTVYSRPQVSTSLPAPLP
jgi:acetylornithine aminotransferase